MHHIRDRRCSQDSMCQLTSVVIKSDKEIAFIVEMGCRIFCAEVRHLLKRSGNIIGEQHKMLVRVHCCG